MRRLKPPAAALLLACLATVALASCGGGADLLPGETAEEIKDNLDRVGQLVDEGNCVEAEAATSDVLQQVEDAQIDPRLEDALREGIEQLSGIVAECQEESAEEDTETTETTEDTEAEDEKTKPGKEKNKPDEFEETEEGEEEGPPNGKAKGQEETPSEPETESESGGVSPASPAGSE